MAGKSIKKKLPVTVTGYQFQTDAELREAKWLISIGTFESLDEFGESMQASLRRLRAAHARSSQGRAA